MIKVTQQICEVAVLEIYAHRQFGTGEGLGMPELRKAWRDSGLRGGDLADGVLGLIEARALKRSHRPDNPEPLIALTAKGYETIASGKFRDGSHDDYLQLKRELEAAKARRRVTPAARSRRRVLDSPRK